MDRGLTREQVSGLIRQAVDSFPHRECAACECFLGYLTQLRLDSEDSSKMLVAEYQPGRGEVHACLGCDPCPAADLFAQYLIEKPLRGRTNCQEAPRSGMSEK